jgi:hypothetical protein
MDRRRSARRTGYSVERWRLATPAFALSLMAMTAWAADVPHISGGVGAAEREELRAREPDYNLKLVTAAKSGDYLSGVRIVIESAQHEPVLEATLDGPILLAKLPPGSYTIKATAGNRTQTEMVTIAPQGLRQVDVRWDETR